MTHELRTRISLLWQGGRLRSLRRDGTRSQRLRQPLGQWPSRLPASHPAGRRLLEAAMISLAVGCGSNPGASQPPEAPTKVAEPAEPSAPPLPVAQTPAHLVAWASMPTPGPTVDTALSWAAVDLQWRPLLSVLSGPLAAVLPLVHWDAPLDAAVALDPASNNRPRLLVAASIGLTSLQEAIETFRSHELPLQLVGANTHLVQLTPQWQCFLGEARGPAPARLVCSDKRQALEELQPYLTRGTRPESAANSDLRAEVYFPYAWEKFGDKAMVFQRALPLLLGEVATGDPTLDSAVRQLANTLSLHALDAAAELSTVHLDVKLSEALQAAELQMGVQLNPGSSWLNRALASSSAGAAVAPERFWQLPAGASHRGYGHCSADNPPESAVQALIPLLQAALQHTEVSKPTEHQLVSAVRTMARYCGTVVAAGGRKPSRASTEKPKPPSAQGVGEPTRDSRYLVVVAESDSDTAMGSLVDSGVALYQDPGFRNWLAQHGKADPSVWPSLRTVAGTGLLSGARIYHFAATPRPPDATAKATPWQRAFHGNHALQVVSGNHGGTSFLGVSEGQAQWLESDLAPLVGMPGPRLASTSSPPRAQWLRDTAANAAAVMDIRQTPLPRRASEVLANGGSDAATDIAWMLRAHPTSDASGGVLQLRAPKQIFRSVGELLRP